jgi:hypothetical protein
MHQSIAEPMLALTKRFLKLMGDTGLEPVTSGV